MRKVKAYSLANVRDDDVLVCAFDTETRGLGGELLCCQARIMSESFFFSGENFLDEFIDLLLEHPTPFIHYAHNAQYDWRYIIPRLIERELDVQLNLRTDTDIYQVTIKHNGTKIVMRDSYALIPSSLAKLTSAYCPELPKMDFDHENIEFDPTNPDHRAYAIRDVEALQLGIIRFGQLLKNTFGITPGHTTAGTALKAWQKTIPDGVYHNGSKLDARELFIRQAYYGGLVFLTRNDTVRGEPGALTYDINSSYPSVMVEFGVPSGRIFETREYQTGKMGIYRCRVRAPDDLIIPILPCRNSRGHMQWRRGEFETVVTNSELIFAARHGYEILEIFEGIVFEEKIFPFNDFINLCKSLRFAFPGLPQEDVAKLMQNSLYGKFGSRRERLKIFVPTCGDDYFGAMPLEGLDYFWVKSEIDEEMLCNPHWAVFITAHARLKLLEAAYAVGPENVLYGDTDSLTILAGHEQSIDVGKEYGQFKLEKEWTRFRAIAPKVYTGTLLNGQFKGAAKGLPRKALTDAHWAELLEHGHTEAEALSLSSLRLSLSKGNNPATRLKRKSTDIKNSSNWELTGNNVRPKIHGS